MKQNTKRYVRISLILYLIIIAVAVVGTLAWFVYDRNAAVSTGNNATITAGQNLEICLDNGLDEWTSKISFNNVNTCPDVSYDPVNNEWWYPISLDDDDGISSDPATFEKIGDEKGYYIYIPLKLRTTAKMDVYLHQDSKLSGVAVVEDTDDTDTVDTTVDEIGSEETTAPTSGLTKQEKNNAIAGAARVGFWEKTDGSEILKTVWVPNATYQLDLSLDDNGNTVVDGFNPSGTVESGYKHISKVGNTMQECSWSDWDGYDSNTTFTLSNDASAFATELSANEAVPLISFPEKTGTPTEKRLVIRIWVEGTDRESNTACTGGDITYDIQLVGVDKGEATASIDDLVYEDGQLVYSLTGKAAGSELLYSYNAKDWAQYSETNPDLARGNTVIYVRTAETATEKCGPIKEISLV